MRTTSVYSVDCDRCGERVTTRDASPHATCPQCGIAIDMSAWRASYEQQEVRHA